VSRAMEGDRKIWPPGERGADIASVVVTWGRHTRAGEVVRRSIATLSPPSTSDGIVLDIEPSGHRRRIVVRDVILLPTTATTSTTTTTTRPRGRKMTGRRSEGRCRASSHSRPTRKIRHIFRTTIESIFFGIFPPDREQWPGKAWAVPPACRMASIAHHVLTALGTTAYVLGLASWCAAPRMSHSERWQTSTTTTTMRQRHPRDVVVNMPSLPSRGHVPHLIEDPLGQSLISSNTYRTWLRAGAVLGVLLPLLALIR
jgi:hypothetical protein